MRDEYSANPIGRPRRICAAEEGECGDEPPARLFLCVRCRSTSLICSFCDRGQIYCGTDCSRRARQRSLRDAGRRYRASHQGRRNQARRTARWRERQKNVTHHGSPQPPADDLLPPGAPAGARDAASPGDRRRPAVPHCHWCGRRCPDFLRQGFLRRRIRRRCHPQRDVYKRQLQF